MPQNGNRVSRARKHRVEVATKDWTPPYTGVDENLVFSAWKRAAIEHVKSVQHSDWEWLAIAQHHGMATRLLDWTVNPLNACYFAVRDSIAGDAAVYAAKFKYRLADRPGLPLEHPNLVVYRPQRVVPRITLQGGIFTVHPKPDTPIDERTEEVSEIERIVIPHDYKSRLLSELSYYGINAATLFPDLDGLSMFINWTIESKEYWNYHDVRGFGAGP